MNLADIISRHAEARPRSAAVIENGRTWTYPEFDRAIGRAANWFRRQGLGAGDVVGVSMGDSALHLVVSYGLARMGAVQLALPQRESLTVRRGLARRFGALGVVSDGGQSPLPGLAWYPAQPAWLEDKADKANHANGADDGVRAAGGQAPWKIVLSSGTTGPPKAVLQTHAMHVAWRELFAGAAPIPPDDRLLVILGMDFYIGLRQCMELHWAGAAVVLEPRLDTAHRCFDAIKRCAITHLHLMPVHVTQLLQGLPAAGPPHLPGLRVLRTGATVVPQRLRDDVKRRLTRNLLVTYGTNDVGSSLALAGPDVLERFPGSVGFPPRGVDLQIVDAAGAVLPAEETGLIRVRAPEMPRGYIDNAAASAAAFRDGWYYPGDLGALRAGGALYLKGRSDDLMSYDGVKIYPSEIEAALLEHPAVAEAAAFPLNSSRHVHVPAVAVVLRRETEVADLKSWAEEQLGTHAPRFIEVLPALPRNALGKVLKRDLADALERRLLGR